MHACASLEDGAAATSDRRSPDRGELLNVFACLVARPVFPAGVLAQLPSARLHCERPPQNLTERRESVCGAGITTSDQGTGKQGGTAEQGKRGQAIDRAGDGTGANELAVKGWPNMERNMERQGAREGGWEGGAADETGGCKEGRLCPCVAGAV